MHRAAAITLVFVSVLTAGVAAGAQTTAPPGYSTVKAAGLYAGVEYAKLNKAQGPVVAHVAHILPGAAVKLQVVNARNRISPTTADLETASSMCERVGCIVGVNGDFHKDGVPAGGVVVEGRMLRSPDPDRSQLSVLRDGRLVAGPFSWTGALKLGSGNEVPVNTVNAAPPANGMAVFTPEFGPSTESSSRVELVVKAPNVGALNQSTGLQLVSLRTGAGPIPTDGAVLSGDGPAGQQLRDLWSRRQVAGGPNARLLISSPLDADMSLGVEPVVLRDGQRATPWRDPNVINPLQPHTLVGWNKAGDVYLVAVDGRQAASEGVNMAQAADFLTSLGVTDAVSLDGGGGTTFVAGGSVWNRPSDNDPARPATYVERGATNALVVVPRPTAPAPRVKPNAVGPGSTSTTGATSASPEGNGDSQEPSGDDSGVTPFTSWPVDVGGTPLEPLAAHTSLLSEGRAAGGAPTNPAGQLTQPTSDTSAPTTPGSAPPTTAADRGDNAGDGRAASDGVPGTGELAAGSPGQSPDGAPRGLHFPVSLLLASAVGGATAMTAAKRRSRPNRPEPKPGRKPEPEAEPEAEPADDQVSIDAFAVVVGGEGARQWRPRAITPDPIDPDPIDPAPIAAPVAAESIRLVDVRVTHGLHELVPARGRTGRGTAANCS